MSWAAHDLEPYLFRAKLGARISLFWCLLGSYSPDRIEIAGCRPLVKPLQPTVILTGTTRPAWTTLKTPGVSGARTAPS